MCCLACFCPETGFSIVRLFFFCYYPVSSAIAGPSVSPSVVYACWIENSSGNNLQNLYVCNGALDLGPTLLGDALPHWKLLKYTTNAYYTANSDVDGVTGASTQQNKTVSRGLDIGGVRQFRICFEIDRSVNSNDYFGDRPAFTYRTELINLDNLQAGSYPLNLYAWMANSTQSGTYSQKPIDPALIPGYAKETLMTGVANLEFVKDTSAQGSDFNDMVTLLTATVTKN